MAMRWSCSAGLVLLAIVAASPAAALDGLQPGMKAPAFALETLDGTRAGFTDFGGVRAYLVVFWAGWSLKSGEVLERAERLHAAHRARGLVVLGINVESPTLGADEVRSVKGHVARLGLSFPVLLDRGLQTFHAYGVVAVPSSVLVRPDLTVVATLAAYPIAGREEFFDQVEAAITGRAPAQRGAPAGRQPNARAVRYFNLGRDLVTRGQLDQAAVNVRKAIEIDPAFVLPRVLLGQLHRQRALAVGTVVTWSETPETLAEIAAERERLLRESAEHLAEAVRLEPGNSAALTELALVHEARDDRARARELLGRAVGLAPDYPPARSHLGALRLISGDDAGRADLDAAIQLNPVDWRLHLTAAEAYEARGMLSEAVAAWRRGVELLWRARLGRGADGNGR
jgi:Tfp pilus assembly protein PilF/peroxiredoxin